VRRIHRNSYVARDSSCTSPFLVWGKARASSFVARSPLHSFTFYGLNSEYTGDIMDTFPVVRCEDEEKWSEYRTKGVVLELYDARAGSTRTGKPFVSLLSPPGGDRRYCHAARRK
jgi:hypothetical protein